MPGTLLALFHDITHLIFPNSLGGGAWILLFLQELAPGLSLQEGEAMRVLWANVA